MYHSKIFKRIKTKRGFGVHSPFVYYFLTEIVSSKYPFYAYPSIEILRAKCEKENLRTKQSYKTDKYYQLLYRISNYINLNSLVSIGDNNSFSVFSLLLPAFNSKATVFTDRSEVSVFFTYLKDYISSKRINYLSSDSIRNQPVPKIDLLLISSSKDNSFSSLFSYLNYLLPSMHDNTIILIEDINDAFPVNQFWHELRQHQSITLMIDFYYFGVAFLDKNYHKSLYYSML